MAVNFFKRVTPSELKTYIPFNRNTRGTSGRAVYINPALLPRYIDLTQSKATTSIRLDAAITGLRALAGGSTSSSSINSAFSHRFQLDGVEISYAILQGQSGEAKPGVYVTDLRVRGNMKNHDTAGLYKVEQAGRRWNPQKSDTNTPTCNNGVISSGPTKPSKTPASHWGDIQDYLNSESSRDDTIEYSANLVAQKTRAPVSNFDLFYTPAGQVDSEGFWQTPAQKLIPASSASKQLAETISTFENSQNQKEITWHVSDYGAEVLLQALNHLPMYGVRTLTKQKFTVTNPLAPISALRSALWTYKVELSGDQVKGHLQNGGSKAYEVHYKAATANANKVNTQTIRQAMEAANPQLARKAGDQILFVDLAKHILVNASQGWS